MPDELTETSEPTEPLAVRDVSERAVVVATLARGTELIGPYQGSGFRSPRYLVRRVDGQVAQLPWLLYRVCTLLDGERDLADVAAALRADDGEDVPTEQLAFLLEDRLVPSGLVDPLPAPPTGAGADRPPAVPTRRAPRQDHLLMLRMRTAVVPERAAWRIAGVFAPLFRGPVVVLALAAFVGVDLAIVVGHGWDGLLSGGQALITSPELALAVIAFLVAAGVLHESGHVAACRYGGAVPGSMGVGVYIVWPAFYSTVTDAYRLSRAGRLRTDLGGVYLNAVVLTLAGGAYLATGTPWLLAAIAVLHAETAWQFLPSLRLDGYYILADVVGVPDLFSRMRPILRGLVRRGPPPRAVTELKPWVRRVVTGWVVLVVPFLLFWVVLFAVLAPSLAPAAWASLEDLAATAARTTAAGDLAPALLAVVRIVLLALPWASGLILLALTLRRFGRPVVRSVRRAVRSRTGDDGARRSAGTAAAGRPRAILAGAGLGLVVVTATVTTLLVRPASPAGPSTATISAAADGAPVAAAAPSPVEVPAGPPTLLGRVVDVSGVDSVTVDVAGRRLPVAVVGLAPGTTPPCAAPRATGFARDMLQGEDVTLVPDPTLPPGPSDRWHAYMVLGSQQSYTDAALSAGWAAAGEGRYREGFLAEQRDAQRSGLGMWAPGCR